MTSKGENKAFPPQSPPCNVVRATDRKQQTPPTFNGGDGGVNSSLSEVTVFEYNVSTILSPIVALNLKLKTNTS